jgi:hypothetical protein
MISWREGHFCLGLTGAEMKVIKIVRDRLIQWGQVGID